METVEPAIFIFEIIYIWIGIHRYRQGFMKLLIPPVFWRIFTPLLGENVKSYFITLIFSMFLISGQLFLMISVVPCLYASRSGMTASSMLRGYWRSRVGLNILPCSKWMLLGCCSDVSRMLLGCCGLWAMGFGLGPSVNYRLYPTWNDSVSQ